MHNGWIESLKINYFKMDSKYCPHWRKNVLVMLKSAEGTVQFTNINAVWICVPYGIASTDALYYGLTELKGNNTKWYLNTAWPLVLA